MRGYKRLFLLACVALVACFSIPANAASDVLNLTNVVVTNKSETATVENTNFSDNNLSGGIALKQVNDSVTLALTFENIGDTAYKISGVSDNLTENYLTAEYDYDEDDEIAPGETTTLSVLLKYAQAKDGEVSFKIEDYTITISLSSENGGSEADINPGDNPGEGGSETPTNTDPASGDNESGANTGTTPGDGEPNTNTNTGTASEDSKSPITKNPITGDNIVIFAMLMAVVSAIAIVIIIFTKNKRAKVFIAVFALSGAALLSAAIYAEDAEIETVEIKFPSITLGVKTLSNITTMQEMTSGICSDSVTGEKNTLTDTREDGINSYIVGKAADGQCWMLQNLRLGSSVETGGSIMVDKTSNTTGEVNETFALAGKVETGGSFTFSVNNGFNYTNDESQFACSDSYGCYYNWTAATAGTGLSSTTSGDASDSICPKGWTLPSKDQLERLLAAYPVHNDKLAADSTNSAGAIPGLTFGGFYRNTSPAWVNNYGYYWARTAYSGYNAYREAIGAENLAMSDFNKYYGASVRCVAK